MFYTQHVASVVENGTDAIAIEGSDKTALRQVAGYLFNFII